MVTSNTDELVCSATVTLSADGVATVEFSASWRDAPLESLIEVRAPGLEGFEATTSDGLAATTLRLGPKAGVLLRRKGDAAASLRLRYRFRLQRMEVGASHVLTIERSSLPRLAAHSLQHDAAPPWKRPPDLTVRVEGIPPGGVALGPRYRSHTDSAPNYFGFYDDGPWASILVGVLSLRHSGPPARVFGSVDGDPAITEGLSDAVLAEASKVLSFLRREYGDPLVTFDAVVAAPSGDAPSVSLGSVVFLNTNTLPREAAPEQRALHIGRVLAHELAHSWWAYSVGWSNELRSAADEMVATVTERLVAESIGGVVRQREAERWGVWAKLAGALEASRGALKGKDFGFSGVWAAALLQGIMRRKSNSVRRALHDLWLASRDERLTRERLFAVLETRLGRAAAVATLEALDDPKPIVVAVRVERLSQGGAWRLVLRAPGKEERVLRRLECVPPSVGRVALKDHLMFITCNSLEDLQIAAVDIQPSCVLSRREARTLLLTGRDLKSRLWRWASAALQETRGGVATLLAGLICVALNPDHPVGFGGLARVARLVGLRGRMEKAASARSIYYADSPSK